MSSPASSFRLDMDRMAKKLAVPESSFSRKVVEAAQQNQGPSSGGGGDGGGGVNSGSNIIAGSQAVPFASLTSLPSEHQGVASSSVVMSVSRLDRGMAGGGGDNSVVGSPATGGFGGSSGPSSPAYLAQQQRLLQHSGQSAGSPAASAGGVGSYGAAASSNASPLAAWQPASFEAHPSSSSYSRLELNKNSNVDGQQQRRNDRKKSASGVLRSNNTRQQEDDDDASPRTTVTVTRVDNNVVLVMNEAALSSTTGDCANESLSTPPNEESRVVPVCGDGDRHRRRVDAVHGDDVDACASTVAYEPMQGDKEAGQTLSSSPPQLGECSTSGIGFSSDHNDENNATGDDSGGECDREGARTGALVRDKRKKKKKGRVHFPDDVIKSVTIVHNDDELLMQVEYNRPVWTYLVAIISYFAFVLSISLMCNAAYPSSLPGESIARSVSALGFLMYIVTSVILAGFAMISFNPTRFERRMLRDNRVRLKLAAVALSGSLAQVMLMGSFMLVITAVNGVAFVVAPLLFVYLWEVVRRRIVTAVDTLGAIVVCTGVAVLFGGESRRHDNTAGPLHRWIAVLLALAAGGLQSHFLIVQKQLRRNISNSLILSSTTALTTAFLIVICALVGGFHAPLGPHNKQQYGLSHLEGREFEQAVAASVLTLLTWALQHGVAVYFDTITVAAGLSLCGPLMLLFFHTMHLPLMDGVYQIIGGCLLVAGCGLVLFAGWQHRKKVELAISLFDG